MGHQVRQEVGERVEGGVMQPLSTGFYLPHSCSILSPDMGKASSSPLPPLTVPVREPQRKWLWLKVPQLTPLCFQPFLFICRISMGGTGQEGWSKLMFVLVQTQSV